MLPTADDSSIQDTSRERFASARVCFAEERKLPALLDQPGLMAVWLRRPRQDWLDELSVAVESGAFVVPRAELDGMAAEHLAQWLEQNLPRGAVTPDCRDALLSNILNECHVLEQVTGARALRLRIFTGAPDRRCGYHVDTVRPGAPVWGLLRVYNGPRTHWFAPEQIRSMGDFYAWLQQRDRVVRQFADDPGARDARLEKMDAAPEFLVREDRSHEVPPDVSVIFRHLNASAHWEVRGREEAWVHCSPMTGCNRLVVNLSPA